MEPNQNNAYNTSSPYGQVPLGYGAPTQQAEKDHTQELIFTWAFRLLRHWWLYLIVLAICMGIAYVKSRQWQPFYTSEAMVIIQESKGMTNRESGADLLQGFAAEGAYRNVNNQVIMFGSNALIGGVIRSHPEFLVDYYTKGHFKTNNLYKQSPIEIERNFVAPSMYGREFSIEDHGDSTFTIFAEKTKNLPELELQGRYGETLECSAFFLTVRQTAMYCRNFQLYFRLLEEESTILNYAGRLTFDFIMKGASVVRASVSGSVPQRDCDFLDALCAAFLEENLARKNDAAVKTIEFIDEQLITLGDSLKESEGRLKEYKATNLDIVVTGEGGLASQYGQLDAQRTELRLTETYLNYLTKYLRNNLEDGSIIAPANLGLVDATLSAIVQEYSDVQIKRREVGTKSPLYAKYGRDLDLIKSKMLEALKNNRLALEIRKQDLADRTARVEAGLQAMPYKEQQLQKIQRAFKLNDDYYTFLMQKRANAQIQRASNSPDNIILDKARISGITNAGAQKKNYTTFLLIGLLLPTAFVVLKELLVPYVRTETELMSLTGNKLPVYASIRHTDCPAPVVVIKYPKSSVSEGYRSLRTRLEFQTDKRDKMTVLLTSTQSGDGKTHVAANMAGVFSVTGRKTILVDLDLRKPSVHAFLTLPVNKGLSSYLQGQASLEDVLLKQTPYKFDVLPVGVVPPNPSELIKGKKMQELLSYLQQEYDYVVLDTSPVGLVTDAYAVMNRTDSILYVARCHKSDKRMLKRTIEYMESSEDIAQKLGLVFNDVDMKKAEYSRYYGRYGYGTYGYGNNNKDGKGASRYFGGYYSAVQPGRPDDYFDEMDTETEK